MILNDIWATYNNLLQGYTATDITRKMNALNIAQRFLVERMIEKSKAPDRFLSDPTNFTNLITTNYITLPDLFLSLHKIWRRDGTQYNPLGQYSNITYDDFLIRIGANFFDTSYTGSAT
ncbi:unnamed protein product, partial [marine sediment metagenome]